MTEPLFDNHYINITKIRKTTFKSKKFVTVLEMIKFIHNDSPLCKNEKCHEEEKFHHDTIDADKRSNQ